MDAEHPDPVPVHHSVRTDVPVRADGVDLPARPGAVLRVHGGQRAGGQEGHALPQGIHEGPGRPDQADRRGLQQHQADQGLLAGKVLPQEDRRRPREGAQLAQAAALPQHLHHGQRQHRAGRLPTDHLRRPRGGRQPADVGQDLHDHLGVQQLHLGPVLPAQHLHQLHLYQEQHSFQPQLYILQQQ